ncbi:MAG: hypothetical protein M3O91_05670 [Chloroflexota bacterium]|nr:hypothetical protein [Chloroflexota bacterium]
MDATAIWRTEARRADWNPTFNWRVVGPRAEPTMRRLRPYMGERRGRAIDLALASYNPIRLTDAPSTCAMAPCEQPHSARGLCHKHYMMWTRDRASGHAQRITPLR